ncbi:MAG: DmsC/YnfH family molybdoenzyme membrane anchor subunit [Limisphaerales bacterium]
MERNGHATTLIDELLVEQRTLTAVEKFSRHHDRNGHSTEEKFYRALMPTRSPNPGEQYAFEVNLDACSGCKACVAGCHSLNGLDENETWREVGLLIGEVGQASSLPKAGRQDACPTTESVHSSFDIRHLSFQQTITSACHHCVDPGCLNGCPVKAYDKDPTTGIVRHLDDQCIGCQYCVMKCPYEVPKYSEKLGIVRKCDMCVNRLAVGEAPACVQSCPNGAIKITLVNQAEIETSYRSSGRESAHFENSQSRLTPAATNIFLADSPNPQITLPTTRYISKRAPQNLTAADRDVPRLDNPHWPLVFMLVFTQAAAGMFLAATIVPNRFLLLAGFLILNFGLLAAPLHLGKPLKAWRAFLGWRTSWLSREIIAFNFFAPLAAAATAIAWLPFLSQKFPKLAELLQKVSAWLPPLEKLQLPLTVAAALVGLGCVFVSGMVYVDTKRACWSPKFSFGNFFGTTFLLGATFTVVVFAALGKLNYVQKFAVAALIIRAALFFWRRMEFSAAMKNSASPVHLNARAVSELLPRILSIQTALFIASIIFGLLTIANVFNVIVIWAGVAAVMALLSEIIGRYIFFRAGACKRMPGGIAA